MVKRVAEFLRSVLPDEWTQLIFLFGVVCLYIAGHLRSWPAESIYTPRRPLLFAAYMTLLAGTAGYFVCFWPGRHPVRRILYWVCLPALVGLGLTYFLFLYYGLGPSSAHEISKSAAHTIGWALSALWELGPGFNSALLGLIIVTLFALRLASGCSSLPLALPKSSVPFSDDPASWRRVQILVWIQVALAGGLLNISLHISFALVLLGIAYLLFPWIARLARLSTLATSFLRGLAAIIGSLPDAYPATMVGLALLTLGKEGWKDLRRSVRLPLPESFVLAMAFPVGISAVISFAQYFVDRVHWLAQHAGTFAPPQIAAYFGLPTGPVLSPLYDAFAEEVIFRGLLQPRFIRRYGLTRGIFLLAMVWAAAHFFVDSFSSQLSHGGVLLAIGWRVVDCLVLSFVLGWLTLQTESVLPATVAHGFENVLISSPFGAPFPAMGLVKTLLWGVLAYVLFRYWPVRLEGEPGASVAEVTSQSGV